MRWSAVLTALVAAVVIACNGGGMSFETYFHELEELSAAAKERSDEAEEAFNGEIDSAETAEDAAEALSEFIRELRAIYDDARAGIDDLDRPDDVREPHRDFVRALAEGMEALKEVAGDLDDVKSERDLQEVGFAIEEDLTELGERIEDACLKLQEIADDKDIDVDLRCEESDAEDTSDSALAQAVDAEAEDDPSLPGEYIDLPAIYGGPYGETPGPAGHVARAVDYANDCTVSDTGEEICNGDPPAGGPHWSGACDMSPAASPAFCGPAPWGIVQEPWQPETLVHNMEHGGVVLWYNTADQDVIDELESLFEERLNEGQLLVMAPYPNLPSETIALTSWSRREMIPLSEYTRDRVEVFIDAHERRFNPEHF